MCSHHLSIALLSLARWQIHLGFLTFLWPRALSVHRPTIFKPIFSEPVTEDDPGGDYGNKTYSRVKHRTCRAAEERLARAAVGPATKKELSTLRKIRKHMLYASWSSSTRRSATAHSATSVLECCSVWLLLRRSRAACELRCWTNHLLSQT